MSKLEKMKNLRGGVIYSAARLAPTTARTWALNLGESKNGGHPRYSAADAVALVMMKTLTQDVMMAAGPASLIVNALLPRLPALIEKIVQEQEDSGHWQWEGGPFAIVRRKPGLPSDPVENWLTIIDGDDVGPALADRGSGMAPVVIPLRRLINKGIYGVEAVLAGEYPATSSEDEA